MVHMLDLIWELLDHCQKLCVISSESLRTQELLCEPPSTKPRSSFIKKTRDVLWEGKLAPKPQTQAVFSVQHECL